MNDEVRQILGIGPEMHIQTLVRKGPRSDEGIQQGASAGLVAALAGLLGQLPELQEVDSEAPMPIHEVVHHPGLLHLDIEDLPFVIRGEVAPHPDGGFVVDGRVGEGLVVLPSDDGQLFVHVCPDGSYEVAQAPVPGILDWAPSEPDLGDPPDMSILLAGDPIDAGLRGRLNELSGLSVPWRDAAAVGTVGRLWQPPTPEARRAAMVGGVDHPGTRADALARSLTCQQQRALNRELNLGADRVYELLDDVTDDDGAEGRSLALALADLRDALESVRSLLSDEDALASADEVLDRLDAAVTVRGSELPVAGILADQAWLREVAVLDPFAWWAQWALD